jgi:hypothetical protein
MNQYGRRMLEYWQNHLPQALSRISDPENHFSRVGEDLAEAIENRAAQIAGPDPVGESYMDKLGRLREAMSTAETEVWQEAAPDPEPGTLP